MEAAALLRRGDPRRDAWVIDGDCGAQLLAESGERTTAVGGLGAFGATLGAEAARSVNQSDAGIRRVLVLSSLSSGAKDIHAALREELSVREFVRGVMRGGHDGW